MIKVVILNAPPHSGKDTLARTVAEEAHKELGKLPYILPFKAELYKATARHYNLPLLTVLMMANDRAAKEEPSAFFKGKSPREALIHVSEDIMKPIYGKDHFGRLLGQAIMSLNYASGQELFIVPDGGFIDELEGLYACLSEGGIPFDVSVVRLHREGFTFENDSREYITECDNAFIAFADTDLVDGHPEASVQEVMKFLK